MTRRTDITLAPAVACPKSGYTRAHTWEPGDLADLVSYGNPDHGLTVRLGRCQRCGVALLAVEALGTEPHPAAPFYEIPGAVL